MKTVKQYAEEKGVSHQAVYKMISTHESELRDFIFVQDRTRFLTPEAEELLDGYRKKSQIVIEREDANETIETLKKQIEMLLTENAKQANRIAEFAEWKAEKAVAIAGAEQQKLLLEERTKRVEQLESAAKETMDKLREAENAAREAEDKLQRAEERAQQLKEEMSRPLSLYERLTGKRKN